MSYRSYPSQSSYVPPPNQNPIPPPPPSQRANQNQNQYPPNRTSSSSSSSSYPPTYQNPNAHHSSSSSSNHYPLPPPPLQPPQQYPYVQPPPPPALNSSQPPPPMYYPSSSSQSQYSQFNPHSIPPPPPSAAPPPPPPSTPPHNSVIPPPPPTSNPPSHPPPPPKERSRKDPNANLNESGWRSSSGHSKHGGLPPKQHKSSSSVPGRVPHGPNGPAGRVETEEERKARKKREYEKQRQEEKHRHHQLKESQSNVLHKTQMLSSSAKGHGSIVGSRLGDKRTPFLTAERAENRLKKPTTFLCKLKFRNELPDPTAQPKLLSMNTNKDQYTKYTVTSLEKMYKPQLFVEPDLGIPLDLLDLSVYNPPSVKPPLDPEDEELLRDDELTTPVKQNGIKKKDRPEDKGFSWLVKTQYISPLSMDQAKMSLTEKQAKELRETKGGRNILDNLNDRESQIKAIEASFEAAKSVPVHSKDPNLYPVEVLPLLPDFDRYEDQFVLASFDNDPTADSEAYNKLPKSTREDLESKAIMKSFVGGGSGSEKFLAYMVPSADELDKDIYEEHEEILYNWVREYNWDVRGDTGDDPSSFLVTFGKDSAKYVPLGTKLNLRKKRAKEGRSHEEVEHYPVPSRITVRNRPPPLEIKESGGYNKNRKDATPNSKRGRSSMDEVHERRHKAARRDDMDNFSEAEDDMSE